VNIAESLVLSGDEDESVWQFSSAGSTHQSLYGVINFKWVVPVYVPAVWKTIVPPLESFSFCGCYLIISCSLETI
jgi:hypothetical protein